MISTPSEADGDGEVAPPADRLAEEERRRQRHRERHALQDRAGVGDRHVEERGQEADRAADLRHAAQPDQPPVAPPRPEAERALPPGEAAEQRGRDQAAQEHRLEQRQLAGDALDEGVVAGEARPCRRPCSRRRGGSRRAGLQRSRRPAPRRMTSSVETMPSAEQASMIQSSGQAPVPGPSSAPATHRQRGAAADHQRAAEARGGAGEVRPHRDDAGVGARQQEAVAEPDEEDRAEEG